MVNSPSRQAIDDNELRRKMQQFGDVKNIKPVYSGGVPRPESVRSTRTADDVLTSGYPSQRLVEMYDSRACVHAHDRLRDQSLQDGLMVLEFEWDVPDQPLPPGGANIP